MLFLHRSQSPQGTDQNTRFKALAHQLAEMAKRENLEIVPYFDSSLPHFSALTDAGRAHVLWMLETLTMIGERLQRQGIMIAKSRALIWAFFSHMKLHPPADLKEKVDDDQEAIDIYNDAHQLIFANLTFFRTVSYSLEDLYCRQWMDLFDRDQPEIHAELCRLAEDFVKGMKREAVDTAHIPPHTVSERNSPGRISVLVDTKVLAPLIGRSSRVEAYMAIHKIRVLNPIESEPTRLH